MCDALEPKIEKLKREADVLMVVALNAWLSGNRDKADMMRVLAMIARRGERALVMEVCSGVRHCVRHLDPLHRCAVCDEGAH